MSKDKDKYITAEEKNALILKAAKKQVAVTATKKDGKLEVKEHPRKEDK
jgi:hypothetical protein